MRIVESAMWLALLAGCSTSTAARPTPRPQPVARPDAVAQPTTTPPVDAATTVWSRPIAATVAPLVLEDGSLLAVGEGARSLGRIDGTTGQPIWSIEPTSDGTWVFAAAGHELVAATVERPDHTREGVLVERSTGAVRWRREIGRRTKLVVGVLGTGVAIEHTCAIEVLDASSGRAIGGRIDGVVVEIPGGGDGTAACTSPPRLLTEAGGRAAVLHAPAFDSTAIAAIDAQHGVDAPIASAILPRSVRTTSVRAGRGAGVLAAQVSEAEWLIFSVDPGLATIRWAHRVGAERDCPPSPLAAPVRFVSLGEHDAVLAQVCTRVVLLSARDGTELFARTLARRVAALVGERTSGFWDASALPPMGARELAWLDHDGAPRGNAALPEDGAAEIASDALLTVERGTARLRTADGTLRFEATIPGGRILATIPAANDRPELAIILRSGASDLVAIALGVAGPR